MLLYDYIKNEAVYKELSCVGPVFLMTTCVWGLLSVWKVKWNPTLICIKSSTAAISNVHSMCLGLTAAFA